MLRIVLIDDHPIVREGFKRLLGDVPEFDVVAEAASVAEGLAAIRKHRPDVVLVDLSLGAGGSGLTLLPQCVEIAPGMKRVVLSMHDDPGLVLRALDAGADAYVTKGVAPDELFDVLRRVMAGERVLSSDLTPPAAKGQQAPPRLSERERETLQGLLKDLPPKAIAADMGISDKTLYRHRANLMEKLGARSTADLVRIARERGLLAEL